ncbi:restriction endonuclease subunit S [Hymenobacter sp. BT683]|uniref:Restriction endonuclease subunit S n=1 Tax=Hymenobacter jeongseonensis TaxID=2791027 RepID=A0ABS0IN44_9BACT|nr:restriction endonuclease subunit S [Hymenobacter jeongseonensis]MBF9239791.1 restriction endonuclease subunit S [Hymenobacter jeongseonensis]
MMSSNNKLPEGWACVTLGELTKNVSIKNADKKVEHVVSVTKHRGIVNSLDFFKKQVYSKELSTYKIIKKEQFAYATIHLDEGSIGFLADYDEAVLSPMYTVFEAKKNKVDTQFLFTVLKSERLINIYNHIGLGSINRRKSIPYSVFAKIEILLPPLSEQRKIAEILSTVDEKMAVIDEQLAQTQELKKGLMQRLLTKGIGHTAFKDSPLGEIPESWEVKRISEVSSYVDYRGKTPPKVDSGVFLVTARNIKNGKIDYSLSKEFVPIDEYDEIMSRGKPQIGDVLITTEAPMGEVAAIDREDIALAQRVIKYRADSSQLDSGYFKYFLLGPQFQTALDKESTGSTVKGIKGSRLHKMQLIIPSSLAEQRQIAEILTTVDDKLQVLTDKKAQYQELKRGLMQQLLTGQRRVRVAQPEAALA